MKYLITFALLFAELSLAADAPLAIDAPLAADKPIAADATLTPQTYQFFPTVAQVETGTVKLSDGTSWKKVDANEDLAVKWQPGNRLLVRWDNTKAHYILENKEKHTTTEIELVTPSNVKITALDKKSLTLSDGSRYAYIPFIDTVAVDDRILISLNENEKGNLYPYFIVGFTEADSKWNVSGEVQAHRLD